MATPKYKSAGFVRWSGGIWKNSLLVELAAFHQAINRRSLTEVELLLKLGADPNEEGVLSVSIFVTRIVGFAVFSHT